jgi:addiction module RelE/StbE family toxin
MADEEIVTEEMADLVESKVALFSKNSDDTRLKNHALKKKMKGKWAFSINSDIRIIYKHIGKNTVRFLAIGPHKKVYKK